MAFDERESEALALWDRFKACDRCREGLRCVGVEAVEAYIEGFATADEVALVEDHLSTCRACLALVMEARLPERAGAVAVPGWAVSRAKALVPEGSDARYGLDFWRSLARYVMSRGMGWATAAALVVLAAFLGFEAGRSLYDDRDELGQFLALNTGKGPFGASSEGAGASRSVR